MEFDQQHNKDDSNNNINNNNQSNFIVNNASELNNNLQYANNNNQNMNNTISDPEWAKSKVIYGSINNNLQADSFDRHENRQYSIDRSEYNMPNP